MYVAYDVSLPANSTDTLTLGLTLATTDVITVYASSTAVSFNAYGSEIS
jgi:uroporphyrinogen-III synthase